MTSDLFGAEFEPALHDLEPAAETLSVSEVNSLAREVVEGAFPPLRVTGELANFTRARSGHCYFTLRDQQAQLRCVMWRDDARKLPTEPEDGMEVAAHGRLTVYERRGDFQLRVAGLSARGDGLWRLAIDRLRKQLEAEGLTGPERKRPIPRFPRCVGVVTSPSGAAVRDILTVIRRRAPWTDVVLSPCRVQGDGACGEIVAALARLLADGRAEVVIVGRGGGSVEDLWAFNEEPLARAIARSPLPVISAVGHETDVTISDLVADLRAPTPSAAAEAAVPDRAALLHDTAVLRNRLAEGARRVLVVAAREVSLLGRRASAAARDRVTGARTKLGHAAARIHAVSPLAVLGRGYALPLSRAGRLLRSVTDFRPGDRFRLRLADGSVDCLAEETE
ncbi:MAG: exodeoxyribonuclease VII large subunit [Longimicrobiaceae bacterium]